MVGTGAARKEAAIFVKACDAEGLKRLLSVRAGDAFQPALLSLHKTAGRTRLNRL